MKAGQATVKTILLQSFNWLSDIINKQEW
jgi:hypothetical protein